ncbi:MAG: Fic family protein [Candidatus Riflebacteria bacterium]|nr:Fic family protein [Candidatus Riflebacteria bacterium]
MPEKYRPPYVPVPAIVRMVGEIAEWVGRHALENEVALTPRLRRGNRIRTVQASLAIENNSLTLEQVTTVFNGKRVLGLPREIQEVRNAFAAYDVMDRWNPASSIDLLEAHKILMHGLVDRAGAFRRGGIGVFRGRRVVHVAPPAKHVPGLIGDLLNWLELTDEHSLIASCLFHYEFEFIHPFQDGNGRMGRLWQTLILSKWKPVLSYVPVETVIRDRQEEYYRVLAYSDKEGNATPFVVFMLDALLAAIKEIAAADQVTDQVSDQVGRLLKLLEKGEAGAVALMIGLGISHRPTFRENYLDPALAAGLIVRTQPHSPRSPTQRYRLSEIGRVILVKQK